ncbi:flagellar hook-associated protein FlgK [Photobacterium sp. DA100]|uniref:flagellar hook-associated protein FlgK n=1 Tax=Photobacterium sp. DA100 TaxID=3027472 RepID=UPI0024788A2E|nr:flagellar hook-associated protein FlgK [Photobacterium sp. DA100]WEM43001.1 flagellar hook-associated protein FlgK [Photobacterium sp. DA100]
MSLMNIGLSGIQASQVGMNVTAQNVANINTPGYSRQQVHLSAVGSTSMSMKDAGNGVSVSSIRRVTDQYQTNQIFRAGSMLGATSTSAQQLKRLETLLSGDSMDLSQGFDSFFSALNGASVSPYSSAYRSQIISEAEALSNRFNQLSSSLDGQYNDLSQQRSSAVSQANSLLGNISKLNEEIRKGEATGANTSALQDERDVLIAELSEIVDVRITDAGDGTLNIALPNGQPLVMGNQVAQFSLESDPNNPRGDVLSLSFNDQNFPLDDDIGGKLGALAEYEKDVLIPTQAAINDIASEFAQAFNDQLAQGFDLNGEPGKPLFVFDPDNPAATMSINPDFKPEDLALSGDGTPGNTDNLMKLIEIKDQEFDIGHLGSQTLGSAFNSLLGDIAVKSRQAQSDHDAASNIYLQATIEKSATSGVNLDEEAVSLMMYQQAYQANLQVINASNQVFASIMQLF